MADVCPRCVTSQGLCRKCSRDILPQLKEPSWHRHAHSGVWTDAKEKAATVTSRHAGRAISKARRRGILGILRAIKGLPPLAQA